MYIHGNNPINRKGDVAGGSNELQKSLNRPGRIGPIAEGRELVFFKHYDRSEDHLWKDTEILFQLFIFYHLNIWDSHVAQW